MFKLFNKEARLLDPIEMREHSAGNIGNLNMCNYYMKKDKVDDFFLDAFFYPKCSSVACYKYIDLNKPVVHPYFFKGKANTLSWILNLKPSELEGLIYYEQYLLVEPISYYEKNTIIRSIDYHRLTENGFAPKVFTGAEAIRYLLDVDWNRCVEDLKEQAEYRGSTAAERINKRISIIESFLNTGSNQEWILLDALAIPQVDYLCKNASDSVRHDIKLLYMNVAYHNERVRWLGYLCVPEVVLSCECLRLQMAVDALFKNSVNCYPYEDSSTYYVSGFRNDGPKPEYPAVHGDGSRMKSLDIFVKDESLVVNSSLFATAIGFDISDNDNARNKYYASLDSEKDAYLVNFELWQQTEQRLQKEADAIDNWSDDEDNDLANIDIDGPDEFILYGEQIVQLINVNTDEQSLYMELYFETDDDAIAISVEEITLDNELIEKPNVELCAEYDLSGEKDIWLCDELHDEYLLSFVVRVYEDSMLIKEASVKATVDLSCHYIDIETKERTILAPIQTASLRMIIAYRNRYLGANLQIDETVAIIKNDVSRKALTVGIVTAGTYLDTIDYDNLIEVFYEKLADVDKFIMMGAKQQKIKVTGTVCEYLNPRIAKPCIYASKIQMV